jgi:hypothetical protein
VKDASLNAGVRCDEIGCIGRLKDARLVSMALAPEAFLEDCARAAVVISAARRRAAARRCWSTAMCGAARARLPCDGPATDSR